MGTSFFKGKPGAITGSNVNQLARGLNAGQYGAQRAGLAEQKALGGAQKANAQAIAAHGPLKRSAAYPKGPAV
jgi:hypothetical protein